MVPWQDTVEVTDGAGDKMEAVVISDGGVTVVVSDGGVTGVLDRQWCARGCDKCT